MSGMSPMTEAILAINRLTEVLEVERKENDKLRAHIKDLHEYIWNMQQESYVNNTTATGDNTLKGNTDKDKQAFEELERIARQWNLTTELRQVDDRDTCWLLDIDEWNRTHHQHRGEGILIK